MRTRALCLGILACLACAGRGPALAQTPPASAQISAAVLALPDSLRAGSGVVVLDDRGQLRELRPSANGIVCLADTPGDSDFDAQCYHASFVSVVYRIRQLAARDLPDSVIDQTINTEIRDGRLNIPTAPTAVYRLAGPISGYDSSTNAVSNAIVAWHAIHVPYRTAAEIGLPTSDDGIHPYLMASGTYFAHVMIEARSLRP
jgi:hypothetical protein